MNYIITGGAGFIGCNIARELVRRKQKTKSRTDQSEWSGARIKIIDNLSTGSLKNIADIKNKVEFIRGDIRNLNFLQKQFKGADFILHQAALGSVPRSVKDPFNTHENNATGTLNVLIAARDNGIKRVVYASSSSIYGGAAQGKNKEDFKPNPLSPYAVSKLIGEYYCKVFYGVYGLETATLRYFNVYGPYQSPESQYAAVIPLFIKTASANQQPIIYGDGNQSRSFCFVNDVVNANLLACQKPNVAGKIMNIGGEKSISVNKLWQTIAKLTKTKVKPRYAPPRPGDIYKSDADISETKKYLGWKPKYNFRKGANITFEWYCKNH